MADERFRKEWEALLVRSQARWNLPASISFRESGGGVVR